MIDTGLLVATASALAGGAVGALLLWLGTYSVRRMDYKRHDDAIKRQLCHLLHRVATYMSFVVRKPQFTYIVWGFSDSVRRLLDRSTSSDVAVALSAPELGILLTACYVTQESEDFIEGLRDRFRTNPAEYRESIQAAAQRALWKLDEARMLFGDSAPLSDPVDPRSVEQWG